MKDTSWENVADWYQSMVNDADSYQQRVIKPGLLSLLGDVKGKTIVDLACGVGFYSKLLADKGAKVIGIDIGESLVAHAKSLVPGAHFHVASAEKVNEVVPKESADTVITVLALQNIRPWQEVVKSVAEVLKKNGSWICVLNHPMYRIPGASVWAVDEVRGVQYRRIERYLSTSETRIDMTPGNSKKEGKEYTVSFHWPLSALVNTCAEAGLTVSGMEEWISHRETQHGKRKAMEDRARKEIPLFMTLRFTKS